MTDKLNSKVSLDNFYKWYEENKKDLLRDATESKNINDKLKSNFLAEWSFERLDKMTIDDYVLGKGSKNSLCYALEQGKYSKLYLSIGGGTAQKFGLYFSKKRNAYCNGKNEIIPENQLDDYFVKLKHDLKEMINAGITGNFSNDIFNPDISKNLFVKKFAVITKLLCIYSEDPIFSGVNMHREPDKSIIWSEFVDKIDNAYEQNNEITRIISSQYSELDGDILTIILWKYRNHIIDGDEEVINNETEFQNEYSRILINSKNIILHGAPGTGKSYLAKTIAADIVSDGRIENYSELNEEQREQIEFVQFHPSYDYTDFMEGLRPRFDNEGNIGFELQNGTFKRFVEKAQQNMLNSQKSKLALQRENAAAKILDEYISKLDLDTYSLNTTRGTEFYITEIDDTYISIIAPNNEISSKLKLSISDIVKMLESNIEFKQVIDIAKFFNKKNTTQGYSYYLSIYNDIIKNKSVSISNDSVEKVNEKKYIFIIDEINRGEISKIFGELFFSIDPSYRGTKGSVSTQYSSMHKTKDKFYVPKNVYIIGTMNDIDRSVDSFDFAMRRRFRFLSVDATNNVEMLNDLDNSVRLEAIARMNSLNAKISKIEGLNKNYQIGAAYFLNLKNIGFDGLWSDYLAPLLSDYVGGMFDENDVMKSLEDAYNAKNTEEFGNY